MKQTNVDLRAANNAVMEVVGVVNAAINALALSGERFCCTSKLYVVENIDEVYLSLDVLRGLRIVGKNFLEAGTSPNQHGNHPLIWDKTGTVVELYPIPPIRSRWMVLDVSRRGHGNTCKDSSPWTSSLSTR